MDIADALSLRSMTSEPSAGSVVDESPSPGRSERPTPKHKFETHDRHNIWSFVFLHDSVHIVSGSTDGTMRKWDCETGLLVGEAWKGRGREINVLALSPDGKTIACGGNDGSIQRWDTNGQMIEDIWMSHSSSVLTLSWSPSGSHLASAHLSGKILIQKAESGEVEVGPIDTKHGPVGGLAYSPSGDKIASGGHDATVCIWDSNTGELRVGPIQDLGIWVSSVLWSSDGSKLYTTSDQFARVFDSISGAELHRFKHDDWLNSIAFSSTHNALACVGSDIAQLWDTESHQPLGHPFHQEDLENLRCASFSRDGRYLAYGGNHNEITVWMVKDIAPEIEPPSSPSCLEVDATKPFARTEGDGFAEDNIYRDDNFFRLSEPSGPAHDPSRTSERPLVLSLRRLLNVLNLSRRYHRPAGKSAQLHGRPERTFFAQHTGTRPVTVSAARPKKLYLRVPPSAKKNNGITDAQAGQSSSAVQGAEEGKNCPTNAQAGQSSSAVQGAEEGKNCNTNAQAGQSSSVAVQGAEEGKNCDTNAQAGQSSSAAVQDAEEGKNCNTNAQAGQSSSAAVQLPPAAQLQLSSQPATQPTDSVRDRGCWFNFRLAVCCIQL